MAKKQKVEEHGGGESGTSRWMLTYLDMITLLFGVFIIMLAMSNVDKDKFEKAVESIKSGFQGGRTIFPGPLTGGQTINDNLNPIGSRKRYLREYISRVIKPEAQRNILRVTETERGVQITLFGDVFFDLGSSEVKKEMADVLMKIAPILREVSFYIVIEGFTDDIPVTPLKERKQWISDNWELAAMRSINVLRFFESAEVQPEKMSAKSYGKYRPVGGGIDFESKDSPEYRALNRSVTIIIETGTVYKKKNETQSSNTWK
jgi:chemotaxis protein MotB